MALNYQTYTQLLSADVQQSALLQPLQSVLGTVWNGTNPARFFKSKRLKLEKDHILPSEEKLAISEKWENESGKEWERIKSLYPHSIDQAAYRYTLFNYVQVWGSRVARKSGSSEVSLFDHNRIRAAAYFCDQQLEATTPSEPYLLVKGGIGGIQKFIYHDIKAEQIGDADKSSKRLRGRSFLVAHLSQVLAEQLIVELEQTEAQILFVGGGHFNLLLPNQKSIHDRLQELQKSINLALQKKLGTPLNFDLVTLEVNETVFYNPAEAFQKLDLELKKSKQQRHREYLAELMFSPVQFPSRKEEERIGAKAPYAEFLIELKGELGELEKVANSVGKKSRPDIQCLEGLGLHYYFVNKGRNSKKNIWEKVSSLLHSIDATSTKIQLKVIRLNDTAFLPDQNIPMPAGLSVAWGFQLVGNYAPIDWKKKQNNQRKVELTLPEAGSKKEKYVPQILMFEELAQLNEEGKKKLKYPQLAAMRLDVDDMGVLFSYGLGINSPLDRIICLSRELQLFFGGYFNVLAQKHHLYITYSGGDDAFVIGSWLNVLNFAAELNQEFRIFVCKNPDLGFSAGIYMCNPHYPVARFAKDAEDLQERAKQYPKKDEAIKNAVCVFNHVYEWKRFEAMMNFAKKLEPVVEQNSPIQTTGISIRRSLLQSLLSIVQISQEDETERIREEQNRVAYREQKDYAFFRNLGRLHGLMARQGFGANHDTESESSQIVQEIIKDSVNRQNFLDYKLPFNYILYLTSEAKSDKHGE